jgi:predicted transcriptional regulator
MPPVKQYMTHDVNTIHHEAMVLEAAETMAADPQLEGYVIILKRGKPVGIITEQDLVNKVLAKGLN